MYRTYDALCTWEHQAVLKVRISFLLQIYKIMSVNKLHAHSLFYVRNCFSFLINCLINVLLYVLYLVSHNIFAAYIQQTGRAGRSGMSCEAIMFYNLEDLGKRSISSEMKQYCHLTTCRRNYIAEHFDNTTESNRNRHECCDNCDNACG